MVKDWLVLRISIHAPTRGATKLAIPSANPYLFQSTLPRGERHRNMTICGANTRFQSTLPRGERHYKGFTQKSITLFQSTLPRGERQQFYTKFHICFISFLPILSLHHISTHSPLPTFNHFLYIFSGANRPGISCLLPFRTKTISGIL